MGVDEQTRNQDNRVQIEQSNIELSNEEKQSKVHKKDQMERSMMTNNVELRAL